MIRSSQVTLKFANDGKQAQLASIIDEYRRVTAEFVGLLWPIDKVPVFLPKEFRAQVPTWLSVRMAQNACTQASAIVRGTRTKQRKTKWVIDKLNKEGKFKQARKLQRKYDATVVSKPEIGIINPELDARFVKIDLDNPTSFDGWLTLGSIGNRMKLQLPFKRTRHFNKLASQGTIRGGIRLSKSSITFMFDLPDAVPVATGSTLGIDIGQTTVISCSNSFASRPNKHGHDLATITAILCRKKKGSHAFERSSKHRTNYVNWSINQLNLTGIKQVNIEGIKDLRRGRRTSRRLSHWTYTDICGKLESYCAEQGVSVCKMGPAYTSQRCSACGWTRRSNRKEKQFKCGKCGNMLDADLNASLNIALPLPGITRQQLLRKAGGFYWLTGGLESTVPAVNKTNNEFGIIC
jgi:transposase